MGRTIENQSPFAILTAHARTERSQRVLRQSWCEGWQSHQPRQNCCGACQWQTWWQTEGQQKQESKTMNSNGHPKGTAVAYVRISSEEQLKKSATSVATQTRKCAEACEREGLELVKVFTDEGESAFKQASSKRPQLQAMLKYIRQNKGKCTHVVFENLSRLARRDAEQDVLLDGFKAQGLKYMSVDEPNVETDTAAGRLHAGLLARFNRYYSDSLSERVTYRMRAGAQAGRHLHKAPLGYVNGKVNGVKNLVPDPQRAELVRKAFTMMAEGQNMVGVLVLVP